MDYCSRQCIRRTLYAVMIGISPIVICLLLIAIARLILYGLEILYNRRQKINARRRSSIFHQRGRPTLSYTPVSITELHRIIQGDHHSQQLSESSLSTQYNDNNSSNIPNHMKSISTQHDASPSNALTNLIIRRNDINSAPLTALFAPPLTSAFPSFDTINAQNKRRPSIITITCESIETTTLEPINNNNNNTFFDTYDSFESEQSEEDLLLASTSTTTTTTVVFEDFHDFHSVHSAPYSLTV